MPGTLFSRLRTPDQFAQAARDVTLSDVEASIACGPDPKPYQTAIAGCFQAGFHAVALHQIGPDQDGFLRFWQEELDPER